MIDLRPAVSRVTVPLGAALLRRGVTADAVTATGAVVSTLGAVLLLGSGRFFWGSVVCTLAVLSDALDGTMARQSGGSTRWGAFLDSSLDRIADGAILASLAYWYATGGDDDVLCAVALGCLVLGSTTSYVKARAQGLGMTCDVGVVERTERLVLALAGPFLVSLGVPYAVHVLLWLLLVGSAVTVAQRLREVRRQAVAPAP